MLIRPFCPKKIALSCSYTPLIESRVLLILTVDRIRFGRDHDPDCEILSLEHLVSVPSANVDIGLRQDEILFKIAERVKSKPPHINHINYR